MRLWQFKSVRLDDILAVGWRDCRQKGSSRPLVVRCLRLYGSLKRRNALWRDGGDLQGHRRPTRSLFLILPAFFHSPPPGVSLCQGQVRPFIDSHPSTTHCRDRLAPGGCWSLSLSSQPSLSGAGPNDAGAVDAADPRVYPPDKCPSAASD